MFGWLKSHNYTKLDKATLIATAIKDLDWKQSRSGYLGVLLNEHTAEGSKGDLIEELGRREMIRSTVSPSMGGTIVYTEDADLKKAVQEKLGLDASENFMPSDNVTIVTSQSQKQKDQDLGKS